MRRTAVLTVATVILSGMLAGAGFAADDSSYPVDFPLYVISGGTEFEVVPGLLPQLPDSPGNPWKGQYDPWDLWFYRNINTVDPPESLQQQSGVSFTAVYFDDAGYMIPRRVMNERVERIRGSQTIGDVLDPDAGGQVMFDEIYRTPQAYVVAEMDPETKAQYDAFRLGQSMRKYPAVPDWVIGLNPLSTVFLPDGRIALKLGGQLVRSPKDPAVTGLKDVWHLFDAYGNSLDPPNPKVRTLDWVATDTTWLDLFSDLFVAKRLAGRYQLLYNDSMTAIERICDYDGTELPFNSATLALPTGTASGICEQLDWRRLQEIYNWQRAQR